MTTVAAGGEPRRRIAFTPRAAILTVIVIALLFSLAVPLRTYRSQRAQLQALERQAQVLEHQNAALQGQVMHLQDPAYLERVARECLGMVKRGEIGFIVVPQRGGRAAPADC